MNVPSGISGNVFPVNLLTKYSLYFDKNKIFYFSIYFEINNIIDTDSK